MFITSKKSFIDILLCFLWITFAAKLLGLIVEFSLPIPKQNVSINIDTNLPYIQFALKKDFALENRQQKVKQIKKEQPALLMKNMLLKGVYIDGADSFAVIGLKTKRDSIKIIPIGKTFQGYKLVKLFPKKVLLQKNGIIYALYLENVKIDPNAKDISYMIPDKKQFMLEKHDVYDYVNHFDKIWKEIAIDDSRKNGKLDGFLIKWIKPNSIFAKIGLKKGDKIIKVNGKPLKSYGIAFKYYKKIKRRELNSINLTVLRNKKEKDIEYELF